MMERDSIERFCRLRAARPSSCIEATRPGKGLRSGRLLLAARRFGTGAQWKGGRDDRGDRLALLARQEYVGFIDADNFVPGSVNEYVKVYASDFHLARSRFAMVRICWKSKPGRRRGPFLQPGGVEHRRPPIAS